jgi:PAS domain S-box-containing protein
MPGIATTRILNVDADDGRRAALTRTLREAGFEVDEAVSAGEALDKVLTAPDLVIVDVALPDLDGFEVARRIRAHPATRTLPVLHVSAEPVGAAMRTRGLESGADGWLVEPVDSDHLVGTIRERLRARGVERELRRSLEQSSVILQNIADAVTAQDPSGRLVYANDAALRLLGYGSPDELGRGEVLRAFEVLDEEGRPLSPDQLPGRRVLRGEPDARALIRWRRRDGSGEDRWTVVQARPVRDERGQVLLAINILHEITAQRRNERRMEVLNEATAALTASLEYETTLERIARLPVPRFGDWSVLHVVEGNEVRPVACHHDPTLDAMLRQAAARPHPLEDPVGLPPALFTGRPELVPFADDSLVDARVHDAAEAALVRQLGARSGMSAPLVTRGRTFGVLSVMSGQPNRYGPADLQLLQDLADRAALALDNARTFRHAEEASELRRDLVAVEAHDLKNPLNAIAMAAALLAKNAVAGPDGDRARRQSSIVARAAERMNRLIHDLLDVSGIDAGRLDLDRQPVRAAALIGEAVDAFAPMAQDKQLALAKALPPAAAELAVLGDRERILQIFSNLIGNAFKFTPAGGCVTVGADPGAGQIRFFVTDTGPGIAPEHLPHVFDRFWRMRKQTREGTGLGLWIVKGLVEAHGGQVAVDTAPGQGATFSFTLPLAP